MLIPEAVQARINAIEVERMQLRRRLGDERIGFVERETAVKRLSALDAEVDDLWDLARRARSAANPPALPEFEGTPIRAERAAPPPPTPASTTWLKQQEAADGRAVIQTVAAKRSEILAPRRDWRRMLGK